MTAAPQSVLTPEEYLARERLAETKSEYYDGEIFSMAGGSEAHSLIAANVIIELGPHLRQKPCRAYTSDLKVRADGESYVYPDVTVVCGEAEFLDEEREVLLNPTLIVEVLSPTTEGWDRGGKFERYQPIVSLQEYVLIAQDRPRVERYARQPDGQWLLAVATGLEETLGLPSINGELVLREVYRDVTFPAEVGRRR